MKILKSQSAMEYLMTYSWAILIIAVVLGALFGLGFFNSAALAPKISGGACQVYRPDGPGTTTFINTEGTCNNELPQYVSQFNGQSSYISTGTAGLPLGSSSSSAFMWIYISTSGGASCTTYTYSCPVIFGYGTQGTSGKMSLIWINTVGGDVLSFYNGGTAYVGPSISLNAWHFIGWSYSGGTSITLYLDGQPTLLSIAQQNVVLPSQNPSLIGSFWKSGSLVQYVQGSISNVQVYNTSLSANEVAALYDEGIGGAPININNLVAWWPLNGNANDYSGNQNNGVPTSIIYTNSWTSGYTAP